MDDDVILDEAGSIESNGSGDADADTGKIVQLDCRNCENDHMLLKDDELRCPECGEKPPARD